MRVKTSSIHLADTVYFYTHDNFKDKNNWMTVKNEFFKAFTLQTCLDAIIYLTEGTAIHHGILE